MSAAFNSAMLPKCWDRLGKAKQALNGCQNAKSFSDFASNWASFLIHAGSVINAVESGSKFTPQGRQWYGAIKRESRADPLTRYMFQARNAEEHDIDPTTKNERQSLAIGGPNEPIYIKELKISKELWLNPQKYLEGKVFNPATGKIPSLKHTLGGAALSTVIDSRHGDAFPPPTEHKGKPLAKTDPISVGTVYLDYLESLIQTAASVS